MRKVPHRNRVSQATATEIANESIEMTVDRLNVMESVYFTSLDSSAA
jgi:hypothetical protein